MAKYNVFMGTARGKVGDIVLSRVDGKQVARQYIPTIKNPKTQGQIIQRAVLATVSKMYAAGKEIFDHSFQGKAVPNGAMQRFLKVNMDELRRQCLFSIENDEDPEANIGYVVSPGALSPTPNEYIISEGTFKKAPLVFKHRVTGAAGYNYVAFANATALGLSATSTVAQLFEKENIEAGDIFTLVMLTIEPDTMARLTSPTSHFAVIRLTAKSLTQEVAGKLLSATTIAEAFKISTKGLPVAAAATVGANLLWQEVSTGYQSNTQDVILDLSPLMPTGQVPACGGFIASHNGSKERSNAKMEFLSFNSGLDAANSVAAIDLIEAWSQGNGYSPSGEYLEGANQAPAAPALATTITMATKAGGEVDIETVNFIQSGDNIIVKAVDVDGAEYYVQNGNNRSEYYQCALTKNYLSEGLVMPEDATDQNTVTFNPNGATEAQMQEKFNFFYGKGVDLQMAIHWFVFAL